MYFLYMCITVLPFWCIKGIIIIIIIIIIITYSRRMVVERSHRSRIVVVFITFIKTDKRHPIKVDRMIV